MSRALLLSTLFYGLLLAGLVALRSELIAFALPFVVYLFSAMWRAPESIDLRVERKFSTERTTPDSEIIVKMTVMNQGADLEELLIEDKIPSTLTVRLGSPRHLLRLPKGSSFTFEYTVSGPRGSYPFEAFHAEATDMLGLIQRKQIIPTSGQLFVFPNVQRLKNVAIRPRRTRVYAGTIPARVGGVGTEFFGVRDYQPGDPTRTINWRASARHSENLYSNEFQQERVADVGIVLDGRETANVFHGGRSIFDHSVLAAAALADAFLHQGNRVGLLVYSNYLGWTLPGYGKVQRERILQSLARAQVGESSVFAGLQHLSPRMFPAESQIVLVSTLVQDDLDILIQLRARGYQVMAVSPDPVSFEVGLLPVMEDVTLATRVVRMERNLLIRRLQRAGIQVIEWDVSRPFDQAMRSALMRPHLDISRRVS
ncbi:MAG: DUF58 domain-containing protein [Chloroflexi bacterium]|nr:DUF58 domain-containing protein [Chloroflexota bacterium]